jgi:hypothetical protein
MIVVDCSSYGLGTGVTPKVTCRTCTHWTPLNPDDLTAPEGKCGLQEDPHFYPFGYWPNTLASDRCSASEPQK